MATATDLFRAMPQAASSDKGAELLATIVKQYGSPEKFATEVARENNVPVTQVYKAMDKIGERNEAARNSDQQQGQQPMMNPQAQGPQQQQQMGPQTMAPQGNSPYPSAGDTADQAAALRAARPQQPAAMQPPQQLNGAQVQNQQQVNMQRGMAPAQAVHQAANQLTNPPTGMNQGGIVQKRGPQYLAHGGQVGCYADGGIINRRGPQYLADGGMPSDDGSQQGVMGMDLKPGEEPQDVADDVPAQLSENEFVIPARVVKLFGPHFFQSILDSADAIFAGIGAAPGQNFDPGMAADQGQDQDMDAAQDQQQGTDQGFARGGSVRKPKLPDAGKGDSSGVPRGPNKMPYGLMSAGKVHMADGGQVVPGQLLAAYQNKSHGVGTDDSNQDYSDVSPQKNKIDDNSSSGTTGGLLAGLLGAKGLSSLFGSGDVMKDLGGLLGSTSKGTGLAGLISDGAGDLPSLASLAALFADGGLVDKEAIMTGKDPSIVRPVPKTNDKMEADVSKTPINQDKSVPRKSKA